MATNRISVMHQRHLDWIAQLHFVKDEIICLFDELEYLRNKVPGVELRQEFREFRELLNSEWREADNFMDLVNLHERYIASRARLGQHISINPSDVGEKIQLFFLDFISVKEETKMFIIESLNPKKMKAV